LRSGRDAKHHRERNYVVCRSRSQFRAAAPTFRTNLGLVQIDVSVLDKRRRRVLCLTADDFTVTIDGERRPVVAFKAVSPPSAVPPTAAWMREIAPDIATNRHEAGRSS